MLNETITKIEGRIQNSAAINDAHRAELLGLLAQLKTEVAELSKTHRDHAENIASRADLSASAATSEVRNPDTLKQSITDLESSVGDFEKSHPQLVGVVNRFATMLANMGI